MGCNTGLTLHYITDSLLSVGTANSIAKIEMAKAFCNQETIEKLFFYVLAENKGKLRNLKLESISEKIIIRPLFFSRYRDKTLYGRSFWSFCYKLFFASPVILLRAFGLAFAVSRMDAVYIRGFESLFGFYFGSILSRAEYGLELHNYTFAKNKTADFFYRRILKKAKFIVTISEYTKQNWTENGLDESKIAVLASGVNLQQFDRINRSTEQLRKELGLPEDKKIITYAGGLYENRGIEDILYCANECQNYLFLFLGGSEEQIEKYKGYIRHQFAKDLPNVIFKGYVRHDMIPLYLKASDILAAPYSSTIKTANHMSPIKLLEYMASKVPVIVSDMPRVRDIVSEQEVYLCEPDNSEALKKEIELILTNYKQAESRALKAYQRAAEFRWDNRAEKIITRLCD